MNNEPSNSDPLDKPAPDWAWDEDKTHHLSPIPSQAVASAIPDAPNVPDPLIGHTFGGYTLVKLLGHGGGGMVYLADQPGMFRQVALKLFELEANHDDPLLLARFQRELQAIAMVEHVYILPVYEWGESDGYLYFSMRLAEQSLADKLWGSPATLPEIARMLDQIAAALDYAHSHGVIHRDLKPANILLDSGRNCLLADFGVAHLLDSGATITPEGSIMGTPIYMSPEQASAEPVSPQSDIYSLGVIIFELVCGRVPFRGTISQVFAQHLNVQPPSPHDLNPTVPQAVSAAILKALSKAPDDRYATASAFAEEFRRAIATADTIFDPSAATTAIDTPIGPVQKTDILPVSIAARERIARYSISKRLIGIFAIAALLALSGLSVLVVSHLIAAQDNQNGLLALQKLDYQTAISQFQAAIQADPNLAGAYFNLGVAYEERDDLAQKDLGAALSAYRLALQHDDRLLLARYRLAELLLDQQKTDEAFTIIDAGVRMLAFNDIKLDDQSRHDLSFLLYTTRGRAYWQRSGDSNFLQALNDVQTALTLYASTGQPNVHKTLFTAEAYYIEAKIYQVRGDQKDAEQAWLNVLSNSDQQSARQRDWDAEASQALNPK